MTVEYDSCSLTIEAFVQTRDPRAWDVYAADDPNGPILATLDDLEIGRGFRAELDGTGSGHFKINRSSPNATAGVMTKGNIVKCRIPEISTDYIFAFVLEQGDFELLDSDEEGAEILEFGGRGILAYLDRAIMWKTAFSTGLDTADVWTKIWQTSVVKDPVGAAVVGGDATYLYVISATTRRIYKVRESDRKIVRTSPVLWSGSTNYAGGLSADPGDATILWALEAPWSQGGSGNTKIRKVRISDWAVTATYDLGSAVKLTEIKADVSNIWSSRYETTNTIQKRSKVDGSVVTSYGPISYNGVVQVNATGISLNGTKLAYWYAGKQRALISDTAHPTTIDDVIKTTGISAFGGDWTTEGGNDFFYPVSYTADVTWKYQVTVATPHDPLDGIWRLDEATPGAILWRLMQEWQHASRPQHPLPDATYVFTSTDDTTAVDWATHDGTTEFDAPVGEKGVSVVLRLIPYGLKVQMSPYLELGGYNAFGVDRSAGAFASGKVRFVGGMNIADRLQRRLDAREIDSDVLAKGDGNLFATAADHSLGYTVEGFVDTQLKDATALAGTADAELERQRSISESLAFEASWITEGGTAGADGYRPGPAGSDGHYWVGDTIRLLTGSGELDYNEIDFGIYAITLEEQENGAWKSFVELGSELLPGDRFGSGGSGSGGVRQVGGGGGGTVVASSSGVTVKDSISGDSATGTTIESDDWGVSSPGTGRVNVAIRGRALSDLTDVLADALDRQILRWDDDAGSWVADYIEGIATAETDPSLVLHPDGAGNVEWIAMASGIVPWFIFTNYGAADDGVTDDRAAINLAIAAYNAAGGGVLYGPHTAGGAGYYCSGALDPITAPGTIMGDGGPTNDDGSDALSRIFTDSPTAKLLQIQSDGVSWDGLTVQSTSTNPTAGCGIEITKGREATYHNLWVIGFYDNVDIVNSGSNGDSWGMSGVHIVGPKRYGIRARATFNVDAGDAAITNCWFSTLDYDPDAAIYIESGGGLKLFGNKINMNAAQTKRYNHGIQLAVASGVATSILFVIGNSIENVRGDAIHGTVGSGDSWKHIVIDDNQFGLFGANTTGKSISLVATAAGGFNDVLIGSNSHVTSSGARTAMQFTKVDNIVILPQVLETFSGPYTATTCTNLRDYTGGVAGVSITGTPSAGDVPVASSGTAAAWAAGSSIGPAFATPAIALAAVAAAGAAPTVIRSDATIVAFDATAPVTQAFNDAAAVGAAAVAARRDHRHGMPATPATVSQHILLADGHATPFTFDDLLQMDDGSDFMWSDPE